MGNATPAYDPPAAPQVATAPFGRPRKPGPAAPQTQRVDLSPDQQRLRDALIGITPRNKYQDAGTKTRKASYHDTIQRELVEYFELLGEVVDCEVACGRLFADVVVTHTDGAVDIYEIKTLAENWFASDVYRQLTQYATHFTRVGSLYLVHEGTLYEDEAWILKRKGITSYRVGG